MVFGGNNINMGSTDFEQSHANLESNQWNRVEYDGFRLGLMKKGFSMPVGATMLAKTKEEFYLFSGQTPMENRNSKVRVCPPELYKFDAKQNSWTHLQTTCARKLVGRKNYPISESKNFLFLSGGNDIN